MKGSNITPNTSVVTIPTNQKYIDGNFTIPAFALPSASILKKKEQHILYMEKKLQENLRASFLVLQIYITKEII